MAWRRGSTGVVDHGEHARGIPSGTWETPLSPARETWARGSLTQSSRPAGGVSQHQQGAKTETPGRYRERERKRAANRGRAAGGKGGGESERFVVPVK